LGTPITHIHLPATAMPDELMDQLAGVFDVYGRYFTGELSKEAMERVLDKTYFEAPACAYGTTNVDVLRAGA
jgi:hypothetical protein